MSVKKIQIKLLVPVPLLFISLNSVYANQISGSVRATSLVSDNTLKQYVDPIEERQNLYQASLMADYSNWLVDVDANYNGTSHEYTENSQEDERYVNGSSSIVFGKKEDPLALTVSHSQRMLLITPDAVGLTANQQEREIISVFPEIRKRIFDADRISLSGQFERVRFSKNSFQDSERNGAALNWVHPLNSVTLLQVILQQQSIEFENFPIADYDLSSSMLAYGVELRKLQYRIELGYNQSGPKIGEKKSAPAYKISAIYESGYNKFDLSSSRMLTDSSFGNGNLDGNFPLPGSDGMSSSIESVDRSDVAFSWSTTGVCTRCVVSASVSATQDEYLEKDEKSQRFFTQLNFAYSFSDAAKLVLSGGRSNEDFKNQLIARGYSIDYVSLTYTYQFSNGINVHLLGRNEDRQGEDGVIDGTYEENIYSVGLGYSF